MVTRMIYIQLLDEGTEVYRLTQGEELGNNIFRVLPTDSYDPEDETWEFPPGSIVRCQLETRYQGIDPHELLVARELVG